MGVMFPETSNSNCNFLEYNFVSEDLEILKKASGDDVLIRVVGKYGKNPFGRSALYAATYYGDLEACELLIKHGAIVTAEVLMLAEKSYDHRLLKVLKETKYASVPPQYQFLITKKDYMFSTEFEIDSEQIGAYKLSKPKIAVKTLYMLENSSGLQAQGSVRILSMGTLFAWGKDIDIYDEKGEYLGMIDGEALTTAQAKFSFLDKEGNKVAIAYLDDDKTGFTIINPHHPNRVVARLSREFIPNISDPWKVRVYQGQEVDYRLIQIFAAFALDSASTFLKDQ